MPVDRDAYPNDLEAHRLREAMAFLGQVREVPPLLPSEVEHIARRLRQSPMRRRPVFRWPAVIAIVVLVVGGGTFAVAKGGLGKLPIVGPWLAPRFSSPPPVQSVRPVSRRPAVAKPMAETVPLDRPVAFVPDPQSMPVPAPLVAANPPSSSVRPAQNHPRALAMRAPLARHDRAPAVSLPGPGVAPAMAVATRNPLAEERQSFAAIIGAWHRTRAALPTLTLLDTHEQRYPNGDMRIEARVLRSVIYLAEGHEREALSVLDTLSLAGIPRGRELQVVRGELRSKFGRCAEGKRDFDDVLAKGVADPLAQRAAQAIARCP